MDFFYPDITIDKRNPLNEVHWRVNKLRTGLICERYNQYFQNCTWEEISFDTFKGKNIITGHSIEDIFEEIEPDFWEQIVLLADDFRYCT